MIEINVAAISGPYCISIAPVNVANMTVTGLTFGLRVNDNPISKSFQIERDCRTMTAARPGCASLSNTL